MNTMLHVEISKLWFGHR